MPIARRSVRRNGDAQPGNATTIRVIDANRLLHGAPTSRVDSTRRTIDGARPTQRRAARPCGQPAPSNSWTARIDADAMLVNIQSVRSDGLSGSCTTALAGGRRTVAA